jgi:hypothetical protein
LRRENHSNERDYWILIGIDLKAILEMLPMVEFAGGAF